jgi:hypothetical protein
MEAKGIWLNDHRILGWFAFRFRVSDKRQPNWRVLRDELNRALQLGLLPFVSQDGLRWRDTAGKEYGVPQIHEEFTKRFSRK